MKAPDISFVIPVHNGQDYLSDCILSVLKQSHRNLEAIVVDDGSTDSTRRLIEFFVSKDKRVKGIYLPKNKGRGYARNTGNYAATSEVIAVLDADDMAEAKRAENTLALMDGHIVYGSASVVDSMGNSTATIRAEAFDYKKAVADGVNRIVHSTMAYHRDITSLVKYDEGAYAAAGLDDWKFQLDLAQKGCKFLHTEKILSAWRSNLDGITNTRDIRKVAKLKEQYKKSHAIKTA